MGQKISAILAEEKKTLAELIEITGEVSSLVDFDGDSLARALARRQDLMLDFGRIEELRSSHFQGGGKVDGEEELSEEVRGLASELLMLEARATANLGKILLDLKKQVSDVDKGLTLIQGYGLVSDHLSRFADRKG